MAKRNKNLLITTGLVILLVAVAFVLHYAVRNKPTDSLWWTAIRMTWHLIPCGLLIAWCVSISKRILQDQVRRYILTAGVLILLWLTVRTVKWEFYTETCRAVRMLWYAFYIPIILIPLMGVFVASYAGRAEDYEMPWQLNLLYIPAVLLMVMVFTNDLHQQVFGFPYGLPLYHRDYTYQWGYFATMAWVLLLVGYLIFSLLRKSRVPGRSLWKKLPLVVLGFAVIFWGVYCILPPLGIDMVFINALIIVALLEACIQSGLLLSNTGYGDLLESSTVAAQIVDRDYQVCYASRAADSLSVAQMQAAEEAPVPLDQTRLSSAPITGGHVLWVDDVSHINQLMEQLRETGIRLAEEGDLLRAEIALREKQAQVNEQNRLYDRITREVSGSLARLDVLLAREWHDPEAQRQDLLQICVISAYVKRRSNLLLLSEAEQQLDTRELEYCLRESTDNLRLGKAACLLDCQCQGTAAAAHLVAAYDFFEQVLEPVILDLNALMIRLHAREGALQLRLQLDTAADIPVPDDAAITALGGTLAHTVQADTVYLTLQLPEGGVQS